jgi:anti-anti-sigma factor
MNYDSKVTGNALVVRPRMEKLDFTVSGTFKSEVSDLLRSGGARNLVIDLQDVTFIDSMSIGTLVTLRKAVHDQQGRMALCNPHPFVSKILTVVTVNTIFDVFANEQEALQGLAEG